MSAAPRPLTCPRCGSTGRLGPFRATGVRRGTQRISAEIDCTTCGHRWWSGHADALKLRRPPKRRLTY
jgi:DNA-directed RNA polymerase subunit RPC12/RpoP